MGEDRQQGSRANDASETEPPSSSRPPSGELLERLSKHAPKEPRYKLLGEVARGGMGAILRVWDEDLQRPLAMKVVLGKAEPKGETPAVDQRTLGRFLDEAQVTGQLDHPGIVPVHELGLDDNGQVYFTMKLVKGEDLATIFDRVADHEPGWTLTRALEVLLKICDAMAFAHDRRVVHRDLKPSNVMVGRFGEVYVMDWGLARVLDQEDGADVRPVAGPPATVVHAEARPHGQAEPGQESEAETAQEPELLTRDGDVLGTPYYMPPEQGRGQLERIGPASDVYSLGAMLYHLLTGNMPYAWPGERTSPLNILDRLLKGPPPPVAELAPSVPPELAAICEKAMAREPEDRYVNMQEFARDLRAFLDERVVLAYRTGAVVEFKKWVRRNRPMAASLAALVLVVAGAGFALAFVENRRIAHAAAEAEQRLGFMDSALARDLIRRADELDLAPAEQVLALESMLAEAQDLLARRPSRRAELADARSRGEPLAADSQKVQVTTASENRYREFSAYLDEARAALADPETTSAEKASYEEGMRVIGYSMPHLRRVAGRLELQRRHGPAYRFESLDDEREYQRLRELDRNLRTLAEPEIGVVAGMEADITNARAVASELREGEAVWKLVERALSDPERNDAYRDVSIALGRRDDLVPLGQNPDTGLFEFWHPRSGARPAGSVESGWTVTPDTGLVFVLLPGGRRTFGAQRDDATADFYDPHARDQELGTVTVNLRPFFISKYEMTQGQWLRATGGVPSHWFGGRSGGKIPVRIAWTHPVENVSYEEVVPVLQHWAMALPTEAQWENAARTGESLTPSGDAPGPTWVSTANLKDHSFRRHSPNADVEAFDDGFPFHAPVGSFPPDALGLFDMQGNVCELTLDWFCSSLGQDAYDRIVPETGEVVPDKYRLYRGYRGASWKEKLVWARPARRSMFLPNDRASDVGVRPVLSLPR